jgi:hypothetical protein
MAVAMVLIVGMQSTLHVQAIELEEMREAITQIASSTRFSTYLSFERAPGIKIDQARFEIDKMKLEERMLDELDLQLTKLNKNTDPSMPSFSIVSRTGYKAMVENWLPFHEALTRLFNNNDTDGARQLIKDAVAAL